jgi:hypothetical protein
MTRQWRGGDPRPAAEATDASTAAIRMLAMLGLGLSPGAGPGGASLGRAAQPDLLAALLGHWGTACRIAPGARCLRTATDGGWLDVAETLAPLYHGATVCQAPAGTPPLRGEFWRWLPTARLDLAVLPARGLRAAGGAQARLPGVLVLTGHHGRLPPVLTDGAHLVLRAVGPDGLQIWPFPAGADSGRGPGLGRVPGGATLRVTDELGRDRLAGAVGELRLRGASVPGGDLPSGLAAREAPDGSAELLGRLACQVTVGGYVIRPAEIEWIVTGLPQVVDARVTVDTGGSLTATVTVDPGAGDGELTVAALSARLRRLLPGYLRPTSLIVRRTTSAANRIDWTVSERSGPAEVAE